MRQHSASVVVAPAGDLVRLTYKSGSAITKVEHKRGDIQGFSNRSRSRLMMKIATLRKHHLPLFVTLTYHLEYPSEFEGFKYDLHKFLIYLFRQYPAAGVIWKLEYQQRGAPHYHLLVYGVTDDRFLDFVAHTWHKIAGYGSEYHLKWHLGLLGGDNVPCVQSVRSWFGVRSYCSKYMGKIQDADVDNKSGRFWGVRGSLPYSPLLSFNIDMQSALDFKRSMRRYLGFGSRRLGFWAFGFNPDLLRYIDYLIELNKHSRKSYDDLRYSSPGVVPEFPSVYYSIESVNRYANELETF